MSHRVVEQVGVVFEQLQMLLVEARPHILESRTHLPDHWDRAAFAATLQAFYNGVENALMRIAAATGEPLTNADDWHKALLERMSESTPIRKAVIDAALASVLKEYLQFRHFFRHGYPFDLLWERMEPLLGNLEAVYQDFHAQVSAFLATLPEQS